MRRSNGRGRNHEVRLHETFRRAEREREELARLRALHPQCSGLHFHPELLAPVANPTDAVEALATDENTLN